MRELLRVVPGGAELWTHLWQSTLVLGVLGVIALLVRRLPARTRYSLWLAGCAKFLIYSPFVALAARAAGVNLAWFYTQPAVASTGRATRFALPSAMRAVQLSTWERLTTLLPKIALAIWLTGIFVGLVIAVARTVATRRLRRSLVVVGEREYSIFQDLATAPGLQNTRIAASPNVPTFAVVGVVKPVLLIAAGSAERLSDDELRQAMLHELMHVVRRDNLTRFIGASVRTIFWFHPLLWYADHRLAVERERACDERVVAVTRNGSAYATLLVKLSRFVLGAPEPAGVSCLHQSDLKERMHTIMNSRIIESTFAARALSAAGVLILAGSTLVSAAMHEKHSAETAVVKPAGKHYSGEPISLSLKDAALGQLLQVFSQLTGKSIALDPSISPDLKVNANFVDTPWDRALELVLMQHNLAYTTDGTGIRVVQRVDEARAPFTFSIKVSKQGNTYQYDIEIRDRATDASLAEPHITAYAGQAAEVSTTYEGRSVFVSVVTDEASQMVNYSMRVIGGTTSDYAEGGSLPLADLMK